MFKKVAPVFLILILVTLFFTYYYNNKVKEQKLNNILDQMRLTLKSQLKTHQMDDLQIALMLSKNKGLIDALENDDEDLGYKIISDISKTVQKSTGKRIRTQVITSELNIFARSWDDIYAGMPIGDYRTDLKYFYTHNTPRTSIEVGRRLGIKATVPLYKDNQLIGYVESISFFKSITDFFSSIGVDLYVLLDVKYTDTAVLMMQNLTINNYIVANRNYNYTHIQTLRKLDFKTLKLKGIYHKDKKYIFYQNMYDGDNKIIGGFVFVLPQRYLNYFRNPEDNISFLINITRSSLYDIVKEQKHEHNKEGRELFFDESYEKYDKYSKDELIQMILNRKIVKKIDGKIK